MPVNLDVLNENSERRYSIAFLIEQIINESINLSNHIVSEKGLGIAENYKEIFDKLASGKYITKKVAKNMKELVDIRNIIAHRYGKFPNKSLLEATDKIEIVKKFADSITKKLK